MFKLLPWCINNSFLEQIILFEEYVMHRCNFPQTCSESWLRREYGLGVWVVVN